MLLLFLNVLIFIAMADYTENLMALLPFSFPISCETIIWKTSVNVPQDSETSRGSSHTYSHLSNDCFSAK